MPPSRKPAVFRILADEDVSFKLIRPLKKSGIDIRTELKGIKNGELLQKAVKESRTLLTHDSDFADPIRYPASKTHGIIIMKIHPPIETDLLNAVEKLLRELPPQAIRGKLIFLTKNGYSIE